jgi:hypothetical protein
VLLAPVFLLAACSTLSVNTDYDPAARFASYRTYQVVGGSIANDPGDTLVKNRIAGGIHQALQTRGLQPVESSPDLLVTYRAGAERQTEVVGGPYGPPYGPFFWDETWGNDLRVINYTEGTLVVDLIDARTRRLVWRAYTAEQLDGPPRQQQINKALHKAFNRYPPAPGAHG